MEKGDVGTAKHFSNLEKVWKQGMSFQLPCTCNLKSISSKQKLRQDAVSALCYIRTSLPPEASSIFYYLELNSGIGLDTKRPVASLVEGGL